MTRPIAPTVRLTVGQALVRYLAALRTEADDGTPVPYVGGVFAIFGHGNVAGVGEALAAARERLPTWRAHNEQSMAHTAAAYAKAHARRRILAVTTSIGPGATNLVTAAALAHVNRLPMLLLPGDVFASRAPDPVLQQLESERDADLSVNDCLRPVVRLFDRIVRPEQLLQALPRAIAVLSDPASCGPVCLALPQDVQTEAFDWPVPFFTPPPVRFRRPAPDEAEVAQAVAVLQHARRPLIVAGGGVLYSQAGAALASFAQMHGVPVAETQAGKGAIPWDHPLNVGAIGVSGSPAANGLAREADAILAVGTRLQDFTTGSRSLFHHVALVSLNVLPLDAHKHGGAALVADAQRGLRALSRALSPAGAPGWVADRAWTGRAFELAADWRQRVDALTEMRTHGGGFTEAEVIGAVRDSSASSPQDDVVVCAAGGLPAELHKLWRTAVPGGYHVEYGYSTMGYEIAGGLGVKLARPDKEVVVLVGDGSYLMLNDAISTSLLLGRKLVVVVLDNRGYGCIDRLQRATGSPAFNNRLDDCVAEGGEPARIDFAAHARSLGADAWHAGDAAALHDALQGARRATRTQVVVVDVRENPGTVDGGWWWEVAIPEVSPWAAVVDARQVYDEKRRARREAP